MFMLVCRLVLLFVFAAVAAGVNVCAGFKCRCWCCIRPLLTVGIAMVPVSAVEAAVANVPR